MFLGFPNMKYLILLVLFVPIASVGAYNCETNNPCNESYAEPFYSHDDNTKYIQCSQGQCITLSCQTGKTYNQLTRQCQ